jgi:hypothetical protein
MSPQFADSNFTLLMEGAALIFWQSCADRLDFLLFWELRFVWTA